MAMSARHAALLLTALASAALLEGGSACDLAGVEAEDHVLLLQTDININKNARGLGTAVRSESVEGAAGQRQGVDASANALEDAPADDVAAFEPAAELRRPQQRREKKSPASLLSRHWQAPYGGEPDVQIASPRSWTNPFAGLSSAAAQTQGSIGGGPGSYLAGVASAAVVAVLCSGDDLVWLTPFAAHEQRLFLLFLYCVWMTLLAVFAWMIQFSGVILGSNENVPVEPILRLVTTVALFWYSSYLYQEWTKDEWISSTSSSKDIDSGRPSLRGNLLPAPEAGWNSLGSGAPLPTSTAGERRGLSKMDPSETAPSASAECEESHRSLPTASDQPPWLKPAGESVLVSLGPVGGIPKDSPYWNLFVMCMVGGLYPMVAYVTLLYGDVLNGPTLVGGVALSGAFVASICFGITYSRTISALCERIPFWCIVFALGLWSIYSLCQDIVR